MVILVIPALSRNPENSILYLSFISLLDSRLRGNDVFEGMTAKVKKEEKKKNDN